MVFKEDKKKKLVKCSIQDLYLFYLFIYFFLLMLKAVWEGVAGRCIGRGCGRGWVGVGVASKRPA